MSAHLLWLQLPFLFLPMLIIGLATYGADFEHPSGQIYLWMPVVLTVTHWIAGALDPVLSKRRVAVPLLIASIAVVGVAYRPLHMHWWDERSVSQAVRVLVIGVCSVFASRIGALRIGAAGGPRADSSAAAFAALALIAVTGMLYPHLPLLALAPLMAFGAVADPLQTCSKRDQRPLSRFTGWHRYAVVLLALELSLPLWDFQTDPRWALFFGLGLLGMAIGALLARRFPFAAVALPTAAVLLVIAASFYSLLVVSPLHVLVVGSAAGWLLSAQLAAPTRDGAPANLAWCTPLWTFGMLLGFVLSANRMFMGLRLILWLPMLLPLLALFRDPTVSLRRRSRV